MNTHTYRGLPDREAVFQTWPLLASRSIQNQHSSEQYTAGTAVLLKPSDVLRFSLKDATRFEENIRQNQCWRTFENFLHTEAVNARVNDIRVRFESGHFYRE